MKVGLDLDGTISELPDLFAILTAGLVAGGHEVHIITYRDGETRAKTEAELKALGIHYTALHLPADDELLAPWKAALSAELELDVVFEDSPEVLAVMPQRIKRLWLCDPAVFDLNAAIAGLKKKARARAASR